MISIVCPASGNKITDLHKELIGAAYQLRDLLGLKLSLIAVGKEAQAVAASAGTFGIERAIAVVGELAQYGAEGYLHNLVPVLHDLQPRVVLLPGEALARELSARLAVRLEGAALHDITAIRLHGEQLAWTRPVFGGKALADVVLRRAPAVCVLRPGAFEKVSTQDEVEVDLSIVAATIPDTSVRIAEQSTAGDPNELGLEEASVVVSGGRGLGSAAGFELLKELADELGGALGASLAAVDEGWAPHQWQIGQTGKIISPDLYIAVGISGASQHVFGISGAKTVVSINTDAQAPMVEAAHLAIVGDYKLIVPALVRALQTN